MYTILWLYLFLTGVCVLGEVLLFTGSITAVWAFLFFRVFAPAAVLWFLFFRCYHVQHWSIYTAEPLREGEKNPEGRTLASLCLAGGLLFGLATVGLLSGPAIIVNNFSASSTLEKVRGRVAKKEKVGEGELAVYFIELTDENGRLWRNDVDEATFHRAKEGEELTLEFRQGALGFYYR